MAAPTRISSTSSAHNASTSPKSVGPISVQAGDLIVVRAGNENGSETFGTPTATGWTFTAGPNTGIANTTGRAALWTATAPSTGTVTIQMTTGGTTSNWWGFVVSVWRNHGGVGNTGSANNQSGAPTMSITMSGANSGIDWITTDFNAVDGTSRTYRSVNGAATEDNYFRDSAHYTVYYAYHPDASTTGAKSVGESAPSGQKYGGAAVEILAGAGGSTTPVTVSASCASTATVARQAQIIRATTAAASATIVKQARRTVNATSAAAAVVLKQPARILSAAAACSATAAALRAQFVTLTASAAASAARVVQAQRIVSASTASSAVVVRRPQRTLAASCASTASVVSLKVLLLTVSATAACSATASRVASHVLTLAATAACTVSLAKSVRLTRLATSGAQASVDALGPGGAPAAPPGQRPTLGVG